MQIQTEEHLLWILDGISEKIWDDEENQRRIDFVHSLGLKCDCVGWCNLNLSDPRSEDILDRIEEFCRENGWTARGIYERKYSDPDSQWFRLCYDPFNFSELSDNREEIRSSTGEDIFYPQVKAYTLIGNAPKEYDWKHQCVSEKFRDAYLSCNLSGLRYLWLRDVGKYQGPQYFIAAPEQRIPRVLCSKSFDYRDVKPEHLPSYPIYNNIEQLGGMLPRIAQIFSTLDIRLQNCYLQEDMPDASFADGHTGEYRLVSDRSDMLIRRDAAEQLLACKALMPNQLNPVCIVPEPIPGFLLLPTTEKPFPPSDVLDSRIEEYLQLIQANRPRRIVTEKDALRILKRAKKERTEDFKKVLPQKKRDLLVNTAYEPLIPYYAVCESGYLSDEYRLLSHSESLTTTVKFLEDMAKEETKDIDPDGIVIAICPDGDHVMLTPTGEVIRISHEVPEITEQWGSLELFIADTIEC